LRLEQLGFKRVIDYVPGKQAWFEENQPREGKAADELWVGELADDSIPTCKADERIGDLSERVEADGRDTCVIVGDDRVVLGLLRKKALAAAPDSTAGQVMDPGPKTFRPNVTLQELLQSQRDHDIRTNSLVTTLDGRLVGVISRADAEATLAHEEAEKGTQ
jgi:Mg/Co/Ni transporter MgtE